MYLKYLWKSSTHYPDSSEGLQQLPKQSPCISAEEYESGENVTGSGNMITHITVHESPTVGIKQSLFK